MSSSKDFFVNLLIFLPHFDKSFKERFAAKNSPDRLRIIRKVQPRGLSQVILVNEFFSPVANVVIFVDAHA